MENLKFRKAEVSDLNEILRLNSALFKNEIDKKYDETLDADWTCSQEGNDYFKARITEQDGFIGVVENENKIIGYLCGGIHSDKPLWRKIGKFAELENMLIDEEHRGIGAGSILVKEFFNWCKNSGVERICVKASASNLKAIEFYRTLGFKDYDLALEYDFNITS